VRIRRRRRVADSEGDGRGDVGEEHRGEEEAHAECEQVRCESRWKETRREGRRRKSGRRERGGGEGSARRSPGAHACPPPMSATSCSAHQLSGIRRRLMSAPDPGRPEGEGQEVRSGRGRCTGAGAAPERGERPTRGPQNAYAEVQGPGGRTRAVRASSSYPMRPGKGGHDSSSQSLRATGSSRVHL